MIIVNVEFIRSFCISDQREGERAKDNLVTTTYKYNWLFDIVQLVFLLIRINYNN